MPTTSQENNEERIIFDLSQQTVKKDRLKQDATYTRAEIPTRWGNIFDVYVDRWSDEGPKITMARSPGYLSGQYYLATINLHGLDKWKRITKKVKSIDIMGDIPTIPKSNIEEQEAQPAYNRPT
ncbi:MAG: hypothetical protein M1834_004991 [Cirrosporium novae-zelandiae]|nr:MAG: hypothetical protein M1834_004991 [Cirrosporium novae-zelandiae]